VPVKVKTYQLAITLDQGGKKAIEKSKYQSMLRGFISSKGFTRKNTQNGKTNDG